MATSAHGTLVAPRTVADAVLNSTTTVTSANANFTAADVGRIVAATGIPVGTTIASVTDEATIVLSAAATATGSGVSLTIGAVTVVTVSVTNGFVVKNRATTALDIDFLFGVTTPSEPVVSAAGTFKLTGTVAGQGHREFKRSEIPGAPHNGPVDVIVKLTSAGTPAYSVEAW